MARIIVIPGLLILMTLQGLVMSSSSAQSDGTRTSGCDDPTSIHRNCFPDGFYFGTASSAYQYEGEASKSCRGPSAWDSFTHKYPERITDHSNGDVAIDFYHRYKEDIRKMKETGLNAFRFSISWSRVLPHGQLRGGVNREGIEFYKNLIKEVNANNMEPFVTLFHWDIPQSLEDKYGGFLSPEIVDDFRDFAELCFREFGDEVKYWITLNEPWSYATIGYDNGQFPPARCSSWVNASCQAGNSSTEPYIVSHHMLLAHAAAVDVYRTKYMASQKGQIGITLVTYWMVPYSDSEADRGAAQRALDFMFGWYMDPVTYGDYPESMRKNVGDRLPKFNDAERKLLIGSYDFLGLNYYTSIYAANLSPTNPRRARYTTDSHANLTAERDGVFIGPQAASSWLYIYPEGIRHLLNYTKNAYDNPTIYITENGVDELNDNSMKLEEALNDSTRIEYLRSHLWNTFKSINDWKVNVKGYFVWSFLDNFEWASGYTSRFGLYYIDYRNNLVRYPKASVAWFKNFLATKKNYQLCPQLGCCPSISMSSELKFSSDQ